MYRNVTATIKSITTGELLTNYTLSVQLLSSWFDLDGNYYPKEVKTFTTDEDGFVIMPLVANQNGIDPPMYRFILPGQYTFNGFVPIGAADEPVDLGTIKGLSYTPSNPIYSALYYKLLLELQQGSSDLALFYTKLEIDNKFLNFYNKSQINALLDALEPGNGNVDLTNYYTKAQVDSKFTGYYTQTQLDTKFSLYYTQTELATLLNSYYTKAQLDTRFSLYYTQTELVALLNGYYTKTQLDTQFANYYTQSQVNSLIPNLSNYYNKSQVDTLIAGVGGGGGGDLSNYYTKTQINALNYTKTEIDTLNYTKTQIDSKFDNLGATGNILVTGYDSQNRVTSYSVGGVPYTVVYSGLITTITGGGQTKTVTRNSSGNLVSYVIT